MRALPARILYVIVCIFLSACSVHPLPDDLSYDLPTEKIVLNMRCEVRSAVRKEIMASLLRLHHRAPALGIDRIDPVKVLDAANLALIRRVSPPDDPMMGNRIAGKFLVYSKLTMAYTFDFDITEKNKLNSTYSVGLPFLRTIASGHIGGNVDLEKERNGKRLFATIETFEDLQWLDCEGVELRGKNLIYPVIGSIGMEKVVHTFIELTEAGGAGTSASAPPGMLFTDTLKFTTTWKAGVNPTFALNPVPKSFRLVSGELKMNSEREDIHKVTISFTFPNQDDFRRFGAPTAEALRVARRQAAENLCLARAYNREDEFNAQRLVPPEVYCRQSSTLTLH